MALGRRILRDILSIENATATPRVTGTGAKSTGVLLLGMAAVNLQE